MATKKKKVVKKQPVDRMEVGGFLGLCVGMLITFLMAIIFKLQNNEIFAIGMGITFACATVGAAMGLNSYLKK